MKKIYANNRKAFHDYEMINCIEAGLSLKGTEVKSIRNSNVNLKGSYVSIDFKSNRVFLKNCHISKPEHISYYQDHDEIRDKPLLLKKREILKLYKEVQEPNKTLIVTEIYQTKKSKKIKCTLCLAKGKKEYDKRNSLKQKQAKIETERAIKNDY